jgi:hypothetical protein
MAGYNIFMTEINTALTFCYSAGAGYNANQLKVQKE